MSVPVGPTHYDVLGVAKDASPDAIRRQYKRLATIAHADKGGDDALFRLIRNAYDVLADADARRAYNRDLDVPVRKAPSDRGQEEPSPGCEGFGPPRTTPPPPEPPEPTRPRQWPPHPPQPPPQWIWPPPAAADPPRPRSSSAGRRVSFWGGLALAGFCRWASTQPEFESAPGTAFWMYAGLIFAVAACVCTGLAVLRQLTTRTSSNRSPADRKTVVVLSLALVMLVTVIAAAAVRSLPTADADTNASAQAVGDPCLIGTWRSTHMESGGDADSVLLKGGSGALSTVAADGRTRTDFSGSAPLKGVPNGRQVQGTFRGVYTAHIHASKGRIQERSVDLSKLTMEATVDGARVPAPLSPGPSEFRYRCNPTTLVMAKDTYTRA